MWEVKLRFWDERSKAMYYSGILNFGTSFITPKNAVMMMNINQKDINGKEIFSGDIVKLLGHPGRIGEYVLVFWSADGHQTFAGVKGSKSEYDSWPAAANEIDVYGNKINPKYEIMGNIHQNPDLLKS